MYLLALSLIGAEPALDFAVIASPPSRLDALEQRIVRLENTVTADDIVCLIERIEALEQKDTQTPAKAMLEVQAPATPSPTPSESFPTIAFPSSQSTRCPNGRCRR